MQSYFDERREYFLAKLCLPFLLIYTKFFLKKPLFVIARAYGELGNRLLLSSHVMDYAIDNDYKVINPAFHTYADYFDNTKRSLLCQYPPRRSFFRFYRQLRGWLREWAYRILRKAAICVNEGSIKNRQVATIELDPDNAHWDKILYMDSPDFRRRIEGKKIVFLGGWRFRKNTDCLKHTDEIKTYFTPNKKYEPDIFLLINEARKHCDILIGVHIRMDDIGDSPKRISSYILRKYKKSFNPKHKFTIDEYKAMMKRIENLFSDKKVGFLISSDERIDNKSFLGFNVTFARGHMIKDLYSLARCDYIVGPPSTYSQWAAFWGEVPLCCVNEANPAISLNAFRNVNSPNGVVIELPNMPKLIY